MTVTTQLSNYPSFSTRFPTFAIDVTNDSYSLAAAADTEILFAVPVGASFFRAASTLGIDLMTGFETTPAVGSFGTVQQGLFEINPGMRRIKEGTTNIHVRNLDLINSTIVNVTFYKD